jgi:hypothetical protein
MYRLKNEGGGIVKKRVQPDVDDMAGSKSTGCPPEARAGDAQILKAALAVE